ncbi:MAG: sigma-54-dependent Fis family transcriptional regulator [Nitrospirae bacterium]|nr:sigma-54-dependent Fis family transcriptional regulator [Nitrospirota bacterium]MBI5694553.1 sigma-54-dependent Fis family transcriptional regulator [Nitrospirota bacterium]
MVPVILVIEDKKSMAEMLAETLRAEGFEAVTAPSGEDGVKAALGGGVDLVLTDLKLPGMNGLEVLRTLKAKRPLLPVIMMTAFGTIDTAVEAVKAGAFDFLTKPFDISHMLVLVKRAVEAGQMEAENILLREEFAEVLGFPKIIGRSRPLLDVVEMVRKAAPTKATILLTGESGTGKELFARAIHHLSPRARGPFVAINCAAIPKDLMESEFFGHEKGAFTGAEARRLGKFELADKGTVFLDEVGEMELNLQAKLLRVLQGESIERVGGSDPITVDVRVVAASNRDLEKAVAGGGFREDLFYRLNVFPVRIPPLRDRAEDVPRLARHFAAMYCTEIKKPPLAISDASLDVLSGLPWKGNVRELKNCMERAVILADGEIRPEHLGVCPPPAAPDESGGFEGPLHAVAERASRTAETKAIRAALSACGGNKTKAAEILEVSYKTLLTKVKDYDIV